MDLFSDNKVETKTCKLYIMFIKKVHNLSLYVCVCMNVYVCVCVDKVLNWS